jgi:hypothetical protein
MGWFAGRHNHLARFRQVMIVMFGNKVPEPDRKWTSFSQGKALAFFSGTLAAPQSELAQQLIKDPYHFEFLNLTSDKQRSR